MKVSKKPEMHLSLVEILRNELDTLHKVNDSPWKASSEILEGFGDIRNEKNNEQLQKALSSVRGRENAYNTVQEEINASIPNYSAPVFKIKNSNADDWASDIILKIKKNLFEERYKELKSLIKEGEQFLSIEDQKAIYLKKVQSRLGK